MKIRPALILCASLFFFGCVTAFVPIEMTQVVSVPEQSQKEIYNKARQWFSQYFVSGKIVQNIRSYVVDKKNDSKSNC
ncbi:MAG: DUF4468 domain-containing protein [Proteobacteria bacterium]|nr:DUF4468 domain-containing protein [Pseudomonadota bacterium]MBU1717401.1 DUF4468 domain-containing protein [Pseudomonadota bacterium]